MGRGGVERNNGATLSRQVSRRHQPPHPYNQSYPPSRAARAVVSEALGATGHAEQRAHCGAWPRTAATFARERSAVAVHLAHEALQFAASASVSPAPSMLRSIRSSSSMSTSEEARPRWRPAARTRGPRRCQRLGHGLHALGLGDGPRQGVHDLGHARPSSSFRSADRICSLVNTAEMSSIVVVLREGLVDPRRLVEVVVAERPDVRPSEHRGRPLGYGETISPVVLRLFIT